MTLTYRAFGTRTQPEIFALDGDMLWRVSIDAQSDLGYEMVRKDYPDHDYLMKRATGHVAPVVTHDRAREILQEAKSAGSSRA